MNSFKTLAAPLLILALLVAQSLTATAFQLKPDGKPARFVAQPALAYTALPFVKTFPALATSHATLTLPATEDAAVTVTVMDLNGHHIARLPLLDGQIDLAGLASGTYFLEVHGQKTYRSSLIKA